jgi:hypothetical protein
MSAAARVACAVAAATAAAAASCAEFSFDASQFERKTVDLSGYAELRFDRFALDRDSAFYKLGFLNGAQPSSLERSTVVFKPSARVRLGENASANLRAHLETQRDEQAQNRTNRFDEATLSYKPSPGVTFDAGKTAMKWGKGYAWNPVGFIERPKDPNDPELAREGFTMLAADLIRNFDGPLQAAAFTPVVVPVSREMNADFGAPGHANVAAKLYLLYRDTDIDLMFLGGGSRTPRVGMDFSRNLSSNVEIHGEWARVRRASRPVASASGAAVQEEFDATSVLAGIRHLSARDTTTIIEYYRNGIGYSEAQFDDFYRLVDAGVNQFRAGNPAPARRAATLAQGAYGRPNAGRSYLYMRVSQKEPFDALYFNLALTVISNLEDRSASIVPEAAYTGITNIELRARAFLLAGGAHTEFGEKQSSRRIELLARLYF